MGQPKAWLPFGEELMLPRVVRLLSEVVVPVIVVAAPGQDLPPLPSEAIIVRDSIPGLGPLHGIATGLAALPNGSDGTDAAYVSSCDVPLLRPAFVRRMIDLLGASDACVPQVDGFLHPLAAVYRREILPVTQQLLDVGQARLTDLVTALRTRIVTAAELADVDPGLQSLQNVNTPEAYAAAVRDLSN
jgi:molybdopterin-guanine dinucleotide biosynthesis protein A